MNEHTFIVLVFLTLRAGAAGPLCFSCSSMSQAHFCDFTERCNDYQVCYVERILTNSGHIKFTSGCVSNQTCTKDYVTDYAAHGRVTCLDCCQGDMCNNKGCGDVGPKSRPYRGPYCFQCEHQSQPSECEQLTICDVDQVCGVQEHIDGFGIQFTSGCRGKLECQTHTHILVGRDVSSVNGCNICCDGDFCNYECSSSSSNGPTLATANNLNTSQYIATPTIVVPGSKFGPWGSWTPCPDNCGRGAQERYRKCYDHNNVLLSDASCSGPGVDTRTCFNDHCQDCNALYNIGYNVSGNYTIYPDPSTGYDVYCEMQRGNGGWIVLQHRFDGSEMFNRSFAEYEQGFGDLNGEFWMGLDKMSKLTNPGRKVRFLLQTYDGAWMTLDYGNFSIANASKQYTLNVSQHISGFSPGTFSYNSGRKFYTFDRDNDAHCAVRRFSGWWFGSCTYLNINGEYGLRDDESGITEHSTTGNNFNNFQKTLMMIQ
ncbi:SCO-spondin-like [Ylistrum balloti]|uniref:SCO-spondin-like n=1 Tax=Ylistrum balloti TaxID=509963 RepID=UPI0029059FA4|nr:SCO-spondin-like [Ylistrum balloti]